MSKANNLLIVAIALSLLNLVMLFLAQDLMHDIKLTVKDMHSIMDFLEEKAQ